MTDRELMQMALDAYNKFDYSRFPTVKALENSMEALRARLAQPEQEPVAQVRIAEDYHAHVFWMVSPLKLDQRYLYAAPRSWKGLTMEEMDALVQEQSGFPVEMVGHLLICAAEDKLKEKNT